MFLVDALPEGDRASLAGPEGHHAADVQRLRVGEQVLLSDGRGATALATVTGVGRSILELRLDERRYQPPRTPRLVVAQGICKSDRAELAVQAMTEVGVDEVVPWAATRSVVRWRGERGDKAWRRWGVIAREAAKQSRRAWLPTVAPPVTGAELAARLARAGGGLVLHEEATEPLSTARLPDGGELLLVVGPEGGISPPELNQLTSVGARPVRLGETVLRTSTAGVAALAVLNARLGRW